jgi:tetratricopeptide (TPR) repeat protein
MLTDSGKLALDAHLAECASCRVDQDIIADLDEESVVEIRDGARIERLSAVARTWALGQQRAVGGGRKVVRHARAWAAAAAILLFAGTAGAAMWWTGRSASPAPRAVSPVSGVHFSSPGRAPEPAPAPAAVAPAATVDPGERPPALDRERSSSRPARAPAGVSADSLLRQAGDARREGDAERALGLYRRLQGEFAGSPEALLSKVPLGNLLLERGREREALAQFDRYLDATPRGALVPEALYGRARALSAAGDRAEAQRAWQRLLREFPASAYAPLARRRIADAR